MVSITSNLVNVSSYFMLQQVSSVDSTYTLLQPNIHFPLLNCLIINALHPKSCRCAMSSLDMMTPNVDSRKWPCNVINATFNIVHVLPY